MTTIQLFRDALRFLSGILTISARCLLLLTGWGPTLLSAQGSAGSTAAYESRVIVEMPNGGVLAKGTMGFTTVLFEGGGILADAVFAPLESINIGVGYSGYNILGSGSITWQGIPSMHLRSRIFDETVSMPAIVVGLQTLGRGVVVDKKFETYAPGLFLSSSKQFTWSLGNISLHGGAGYSFDLVFRGQGVNVWGGVEQSLGSAASILAELNPTLDDPNSGFLAHLAVRWVVTQGFTLELQARDLFSSIHNRNNFTRVLAFEIIRRI